MFKIVKLFKMQKELDEIILEKIGGRFDYMETKKVLALLTELGELTNEIRSIKFWSEDQKVRREKALEEFVDCLHFLVSIGLDIEIDPKAMEKAMKLGLPEFYQEMKVQEKEFKHNQLIDIKTADAFYAAGKFFDPNSDERDVWISTMSALMGLAHTLGFSEEEVDSAYEAKREKNIKRQADGY